MAENNTEEKVPGFILQSQHFTIKFVAGFQKELVSKVLEYEMDWMEVMAIILENLESFPTSVKKLEEVLARDLDDWIISNGAPENIEASVKIEEQVYFPPPLGSQKSLKLFFSDKMKTKVLFHIKKKSNMKTLKDLGAASVVQNLKMEKDIYKLEIPVTLCQDLFKAFRNDFSVNYYQYNIICCCKHKEGILNQSQPCNVVKRQIISNSGKQQQNKKRKIDVKLIKKKKTKGKFGCTGCGKSFRRISSHKCKMRPL
jgi:hypothetical protein